MHDTLNWTATKEESEAFRRMAKRAYAIDSRRSIGDYMMDLEACHCNGCPLDIEKLEKADDFNFTHDVFGIVGHLDRRTGQLTRCFLPRCARPQPATQDA